MEAGTKSPRTEAPGRDRSPQARKGIYLRKPVFLICFVFALLLIIKIIFSGIYLGFIPFTVPATNLALAEDQKKAKATQGNENDLEEKARLLSEREKELQKREQELLPLKKEIDEKLAELNELQARLTAYAKELADREKALKDSKIGHLVALYSAMDPVKAATIMEKLNTQTVVRILASMKGKSAGQILAQMDPERGAEISEKLSHVD